MFRAPMPSSWTLPAPHRCLLRQPRPSRLHAHAAAALPVVQARHVETAWVQPEIGSISRRKRRKLNQTRGRPCGARLHAASVAAEARAEGLNADDEGNDEALRAGPSTRGGGRGGGPGRGGGAKKRGPKGSAAKGKGEEEEAEEYDAPNFIPNPDLAEEQADAQQGHDIPLNRGFFRERGNYTPFEYIGFTDEDITHEVITTVEAPVSKCFRIWENRMNWLEWFDLLGQMIQHKENPDLCSFFIFYRWGQLPWLELFTTLCRSSIEENSHIIEESVEGMDFVSGALFEELGDNSTQITLRVGYYLPEPLKDYVGPIGLYGHVNDILKENMSQMKSFIEKTDLEGLEQARQEDREGMLQFNKTMMDFVRETYGTEEELQEQAVEWLEQQDLREFQREYEAELAQAAVQFGEAEDEFEEKANPAAYAFGDGEVEDNFEIEKLTEEELAEAEQAETEAETAQAQAEAEVKGPETAEEGGQEATAGSMATVEQQQDGTGNDAGQAAQGVVAATQGEDALQSAGAQQAEAQTQQQTSPKQQTQRKPISAAASGQQAEADEGQNPAAPAPKRQTRRKAASAETAPSSQADVPAPPRRQTRRKATSQKTDAGEVPKRSRRKAAADDSPTKKE